MHNTSWSSHVKAPEMLLGLTALLCLVSCSTATILQNGQVRVTDYPDTKIELSEGSWTTYGANATEIQYMGRWDAKYVSHWS